MAYKNPLDPRNRAARLRHYYKNKEQYLDRNRIRKEKIRDWLQKTKNVPCMDCKNIFPSYVMQFDHRLREEKKFEISYGVYRFSWKKVLEEIAKCDIVCANCHAIRTYKQVQIL